MNKKNEQDWIDINVIREQRQGKPRNVSVIIIQNSAGELLVARTKRLPNHWTLIGGGIEPTDKNPIDTIRREVCEELGINIKKDEVSLVKIGSSDLDDGIVYFFIHKDPIETKLILNEELIEVAWFDLDSLLKKRLMPATRHFLNSYRSK